MQYKELGGYTNTRVGNPKISNKISLPPVTPKCPNICLQRQFHDLSLFVYYFGKGSIAFPTFCEKVGDKSFLNGKMNVSKSHKHETKGHHASQILRSRGNVGETTWICLNFPPPPHTHLSLRQCFTPPFPN